MSSSLSISIIANLEYTKGIHLLALLQCGSDDGLFYRLGRPSTILKHLRLYEIFANTLNTALGHEGTDLTCLHDVFILYEKV